MATASSSRQSVGVVSEIKTDFHTKEGSYRRVNASEYCRPSRQPLFGKELSPVQISLVSCKCKDGLQEWIVFNSSKELYFYPFEGVGKVSGLCILIHWEPQSEVCSVRLIENSFQIKNTFQSYIICLLYACHEKFGPS